MSNKKYDLANDKACGFHILRARDLDRIGTAGFIEKLKERTAGTKVYISVDIDVLDPAYAPATGTAEVGGWTTRELSTILDGLAGMEVIGADVVEVAPVSRSEARLNSETTRADSLIERFTIIPAKQQRLPLPKLFTH